MRFALLLASFALAATTAFAQSASPPQFSTVQGEAVEVIDVDAYTYIRLKTKEGDKWVAVTRAVIKKGEAITVNGASLMPNFESKTLNRKFEKIWFGNLGGPAGKQAKADANPHGSAQPVAASTEKVAKATGADAKTVAEVFGGKSALKDKPVTVRGKVVKVNAGVMGKNWLHLQDGTGKAADNTHDLIVTSQEVANVGEVVSVKGTVRTDVKLGSGYAYDVMVENATLARK
jgi:hypothetical protein